MPICPKCKGNGKTRPSPYEITPCSLCKGTGWAPKLPSGEYRLAHPGGGMPLPPEDRETLIPCPDCEHCPRCGGTHAVKKS